MKKTAVALVAAAFALVAASLIFCAGPTSAADLPKILRLGTMPVGTTVNTAGIGLADLISKNTAMDVKVVPVAVEVVWIPMMVSGEMDFGVGNGVEYENAYLTKGVYGMVAKKVNVKTFPVRMVAKGGPLHIGFLVRGDAPYKKVADLKGARVPLYPPGSSIQMHTLGCLANGGLTAEDVVNVPVSNPLEATRALIDGRADAVQVAVNAPMIMEAVTKLGAHFLPLDTSAEAIANMQKVNRQYFASAPADPDPNVMKEPIPEVTVDTGLVASAQLSDDAVYAATKALWENRSQLAKKPVLNQWKPDEFVDPARTFVPYHSGAVRYWKEIGLWSPQMEEVQNRLLAQEPK